MKALFLAIALLAANPAAAGGPVIIEDAAEAVEPHRSPVPFIVGGLVLLALIAGQSGNCVQPEEPTAPPAAGGC